jgi:DnaJ family protein B protein 4
MVKVAPSRPTDPGWTDTFPGLGMPRSKNPEERGNLVVGVCIMYPKELTEEQKERLKDLL